MAAGARQDLGQEGLRLEAKCSFGVASARHVSGLVVKGQDSPFLFDAPLGPSVIRWDIEKGERLKQLQVHSDLVVCMRYSPNGVYIATAGTGGEIKIWNTKWELLASTDAPVKSLFHLAWSKDSDRFLVVSNGFESSALLYSLDQASNGLNISCLWHALAGQYPTRDPSTNRSHDQISHDQSSHDQSSHDQSHDLSHDQTACVTASAYRYGDLFYMGEINDDGSVIVVEEREEACTMVHQYSPEGQPMKSLCLKSIDGSKEVHTLMISTINDGRYVTMVQGGFIIVIKGEELELVNTIKIGFTSRACVWDGNRIVLPSDNGKLVWVDVETGIKVHEFKAGSSDFIVHVDWSENQDAVWVCGFSNLSYCPVSRDETGSIVGVSSKFSVSTHEISCCGVGFSPDSTHLAVGDLAGNVYLYKCAEGLYQPQEMWNVGASVRCMEWLNDSIVLAGCLDGQVHMWRIGHGIQIFFAVEGSALHIRVSNDSKSFAVGSSKGKLCVFSLVDQYGASLVGGTNGCVVCPTAVFTAHEPQPGRHDDRFGQLGKQAEVWSLCWSPNDDRIATCSEDQTVRVWHCRGPSSWRAVVTLAGHQLAVTSVDWKIISGRGLLVSCSDDRTIRVYDTDSEDYQLLNIMNTKDVHGWHTLTYLAMDPAKDSSRLLVSTQNGYLVLFDITTGKTLLTRKMHCGSVEGLRWAGHHGSIATVGGDCAAYLWNFVTENRCYLKCITSD